MAENINTARAGLNTDNLRNEPGTLTFSLNSLVESFDGQRIAYQNEQSNNLCTTFPKNLRPVGVFFVAHLNRNIYFLVNLEGESQIAYTENDDCTLHTLLEADCLHFSIDHPILTIVAKITNCSSLQIYWTDNYNERRFIDFDDLPFREVVDPLNDFKKIKILGEVDCNHILVQPAFSIPKPEIIGVEEGGGCIEGNYEFIVCYSNKAGEIYSPFYNATSGISIHDPNKVTQDFNLPTTKAIRVKVSNLDNTGLYDNFNLVVIETINAISSIYEVGTYPISDTEATVLYTGRKSKTIQLTTQELFQKYQYYDIAGGVTTSDDRLIWYDLKEKQRINHLEIWRNVLASWVSYKIPYNEQEGYYNPMNIAKYKGYMRDEVYPLEGVFILKNGKQSDRFPLYGREATNYDREIIANLDAQTLFGTECDPAHLTQERWKIYNTASVTHNYPDTEDVCYKGKFQKGEFAYWESEEEYPKNPIVWGSLSGQKIRHFKFPDELISPRYSTQDNHEFIYPIGVEIDKTSLLNAIASSDLTQEEKDDIVGFKIVRGDRIGNESIVAKGLLHNVGKTNHNDQDFYYPNYPFNDVRSDPYFVGDKGIEDHAGFRPDKSIHGFGDHSLSRFTFHSPDTHFNQPFGVDTGYLKMETVEYGTSKGHFVPIKDNAEYKFLSQEINRASVGIGVAGGFTLAAGTFGWPTFSVDRVIPTFVNAQEMFEKLAPFTNFGYSHNSVGEYLKSYAIPNEGFKNRGIDYGRYLKAGNYRVEDGTTINNNLRESSVYLHTNGDFKFTHDYNGIIPEDTSRYTVGSYEGDLTLAEFILSLTTSPQLVTDEDIRTAIGVQQTLQELGDLWDFTFGTYTGDQPNIGDVYSTGGQNYEVYSSDGISMVAIRVVLTGVTPITPAATGTFTLVSAEDPASTPATSIPYTSALQEAPNPDPNAYLDTIRIVVDDVDTIFEYDNLAGIDGRIAQSAILTAYQRNINSNPPTPETYRYADISGYYGSIKRYAPAQWGTIRSYEVVDTGFYQKLTDEVYETVFGGDTYINKFALKIKLQMFDQTTVLGQDSADINYKKVGSLGYPMFFISTEPQDFKLDIQEYVDKILKVVNSAPGVKSKGSVLSKIWSVIKGILSGGSANVVPVMGALVNIFNQIYLKLGKKNVNLDAATVEGYIERGLMYIYSYGIPTFFCESQVNVDYRQAINDTFGEFYPHIGATDNWLQEAVTPIIHDNNYTYNQSFSKQNRENYYTVLPEDYDPSLECKTFFPNTSIWSDKTNLNETLNNWLIYRPVNKHDFPKTFGKLTSLDGLQNRLVLARFENQSQLYNAITTLDSSTNSVYLGDNKLFSAPPIDITNSDTGSLGSQHKFISKSKNGTVFVDSLRGQIVILRGQQPELLSDKGMSRWFKRNLSFKIKEYLPSISTDNHFTGCGLHGTYDAYYDRLILTKKDFIPKEGVTYENGKFYIDGDGKVEITLGDPLYFVDRSWTISYNFLINAWVSFHSYIPDFYIPNVNYFTTGKGSQTWKHNQSFDSYCVFYGKEEPYVLEYPYNFKQNDEIIQSISDYSTALKYTSFESFYKPDELLYFNKMLVYNESENSGYLNLVEKPKGNPFASLRFPKYNVDSKDILMSKKDGIVNVNGFFDVVKNKSVTNFTEVDLINKELNQDNMDYSMKNFKKGMIRGKDAKIRLTLDNDPSFKLISQFIISETTDSII